MTDPVEDILADDFDSRMLRLQREQEDSLLDDFDDEEVVPSDGAEIEPMHNSKDDYTNPAVIKEKPIHRLIAYDVAKGVTTKEIAEKFRYSEAHVNNLKRTDWFKKNVANLIHECMADDFTEMLNAGAVEAFQVQMELMTDKKTPASVRNSAAQAILDRSRGRAVSSVQISKTVDDSAPVDEWAKLEQEKKELEAELKDETLSA